MGNQIIKKNHKLRHSIENEYMKIRSISLLSTYMLINSEIQRDRALNTGETQYVYEL